MVTSERGDQYNTCDQLLLLWQDRIEFSRGLLTPEHPSHLSCAPSGGQLGSREPRQGKSYNSEISVVKNMMKRL